MSKRSDRNTVKRMERMKRMEKKKRIKKKKKRMKRMAVLTGFMSRVLLAGGGGACSVSPASNVHVDLHPLKACGGGVLHRDFLFEAGPVGVSGVPQGSVLGLIDLTQEAPCGRGPEERTRTLPLFIVVGIFTFP